MGREIAGAPTMADLAQTVRQPSATAPGATSKARRRKGNHPSRRIAAAPVSIKPRQAATSASHCRAFASSNHAAIPAAKATASHGARSNPALARKRSSASRPLDKR